MMARTLVVDMTDSGEVYVDNFPGALEIRVKRGNAEVFDIVGPALVEMQHGPINATVAENGIGGALSLLTRRGNIMLTLALEARANIDAETRRGMIVSNVSMPGLDPWGKLSPSGSSRRVLGRIGNAHATAKLVSLEGGIMIIRSLLPGRAQRVSMP